MNHPHGMAAPLLAGGGLRIVLIVTLAGIAATAVLLLCAYRK
ncbi:hypothetical protein [Streptomyces sp. NPDC003480]